MRLHCSSAADAHPTQFGSRSLSGAGPEAAGNLGEALEQFRGSGGLSRAGGKDRADVVAGYQSGEQRGLKSRGVGRAMEDKEDGGASLLHQIIDFAPTT